MHKLVWACGLACLLLGASAAHAQDYDGETLPAPKSSRLTERAPVRSSEQVSPKFLRLQRAIQRAEERRQRIETRKWYGASILADDSAARTCGVLGPDRLRWPIAPVRR